ncbi:GPI-anchored protein LLG1 [Juglans microcarpa x Juglans regia]|uniref:GPI-anchored protein LLG1 n=1 Tax=Juglans microcarpa x Juglans regia TaxID=2249226 RepID=UPI001B7F40DF|nr:GPI-anchored protein LLG1 [Juglans microcarpa x Juglans regia]
MASKCFLCFCSAIFFSFLLMGLLVSSSSPSTFISDSIFESYSSTGRNLLQARKACPVNFEFLNYTIITSKCKGPRYPADLCCASFKEFACPYADVLNDLTNDCATTMFSYINLYGKYPPGLFASECREGKEGLACPAPTPSESANESESETVCYPSSLLMLTAGFLLGLLTL